MKKQTAQMTDKLKKIEILVNEKKIEIKALNSKLNVSYDYETELNNRMIWAKENTEKQRIEFIKKTKELSELFDEMKKIVDVFTGNFYSH